MPTSTICGEEIFAIKDFIPFIQEISMTIYLYQFIVSIFLGKAIRY